MSQKTPLTYFLLSVVITVVLVVSTNVFTYYKLTTGVNQQLQTFQTQVSDALHGTQESLLDAIKQEHTYGVTQRAALENKTIENFKKLQDVINRQATQIKLDLESQASNIENVRQQAEAGLGDISQQVGGLKKKSSELESKISEINVQSSDFSAIVQDVVKAVVSVRTPSQQGSGVFYDGRGYIVTNKHVIQDASSVQVIDYAGRVYAAQVIGTATNADIAILKISGPDAFPSLSFASEDSIRVGQRVIAVGNPLGLSFSVTEGIISAVNRVIDASGVPYIQTDVSINPGNSGGPLVDAGMHIVGITTLKFQQGEGLGFALPSTIVQQVAEQAISS
ncbi:MAG: trypsin-like peptidase domain-containing protein [Candidatus Woesearchaeota archaeon]|nr:trypsin-like peptidase domain-containing protein [Candidatus Woesearchaeota archaeon]